MSSTQTPKSGAAGPVDAKDADKTKEQKPNVSLEEDDEFEDFPVSGE
jgi:hypothetical protein